MSQNRAGHEKSFFYGYIRPFTKQGIFSFVSIFLLALVPVIQILIFPIAFLRDARWWEKAGNVIRLSLKMLVVQVLLFAPALAIYLVSFILGDILGTGPGWIYYVFMAAVLWTGISALIRTPMALAHVARGGTITEALDARLVKRLISAAFGRYLVSLLMIFPFILLMLLGDLMSLTLAYIYGAFITAWLLSCLGYTALRCYDIAAPQIGISVNAHSAFMNSGMPKAVKSFISVILAIAMIAQPVLLRTDILAFEEDQRMAEGNYPKHSYTREEYDAAVLKFSRNGMLNKNTKLYYNRDDGRFFCAAKPSSDSKFQEVYVGFVADCLPVVSTVKNVYEWNKYRKIANDPNRSDQERSAARILMWVKGTGAVLSVAGPLGKAASGVAGKTAVTHLVVKAGNAATDPAMQKIIGALDRTIWGWDRVGDAAKLGVDAAAPYAPEEAVGLVTPVPVTNNTEAYGPFSGTYRGKLVCPPLPGEMYGMKATYADPDLVICIEGDGVMSVYYTFDSAFEYEAPYGGVRMTGRASMPVEWTDLQLTQTESGYSGQFTTYDFYFTSTTKYSGEAYENEGEDTSEVYVEIKLDIEFTLNTDLEASARGTITHSNKDEAMTGTSPDMVMTFDLRKVS